MNSVLILGGGGFAADIVAEIRSRPLCGWCVIGIVDDGPELSAPLSHCALLGAPRDLAAIIDRERPDCVVVALTERRGRIPVAVLVESCIARGIHVEEAADFYEHLTGRLALESLAPASIVFSRHFRRSHVYDVLARGFSLLVAVAGLMVLWPLMAMIAIAIKLDSPGPVLFRHNRVGVAGRSFMLLKFRTMRECRSHRSEWEGDNADRVTRVGRWLRKCRLDELPQFVNVLRGDMNVVGPRPHPVSNLALFSLVARNLNELTGTPVGFYALRTMVRPGITGWAQTRYGYANNLDEEIEKLRYDLYYVKYASFLLDLRILFDTIAVVVRGYSLRDSSKPAHVEQPAPIPPLLRTIHLTKQAS
jgi:exopolysaccharide biosynthesis polyprenyl glycosylphosphotransferase